MSRNRLKTWPVIVYACVVAAGQIAVIAAGVLAGPDLAPALLLGGGIAVWAVAGLWLGMRMTFREKALIALVEKCAIDQNRAYFEHIVPADILAAAGVPAHAERGGDR